MVADGNAVAAAVVVVVQMGVMLMVMRMLIFRPPGGERGEDGRTKKHMKRSGWN